MRDSVAIHWFGQDLRVSDNPSLRLASRHDLVLPIYILDDENSGCDAMGSASRWWLHHSLSALNVSLGGMLSLYCGDPREVFDSLFKRYDVKGVYWNRGYEPWRRERDGKIKAYLKSKAIEVVSTNGSLLWEPWRVTKENGEAYKVFTAFYRKGCLGGNAPRVPLAPPSHLRCVKDEEGSLSLESLGLLPRVRWDKSFFSYWDVGEEGAKKRFGKFLSEGLDGYKEGRDYPWKSCVSRLSPHIHFGEISPNTLWYGVRGDGDGEQREHFCRELAWREFSYTQLYYNPDLPRKNLQSRFDRFCWEDKEDWLRAWKRGETGVPLVDAGMRELWQTGYMHNRVRMVVGSFLVKNLRIHWRHGERCFWDRLVDADLASNSASWQWVAGCGADAAPYFRIFNPVKQGQKFDAEGVYIRKFVPELASLPDRYLSSPWEAPEEVLREAGVELGLNYPRPIVDLKASREAALLAFRALKDGLG